MIDKLFEVDGMKYYIYGGKRNGPQSTVTFVDLLHRCDVFILLNVQTNTWEVVKNRYGREKDLILPAKIDIWLKLHGFWKKA